MVMSFSCLTESLSFPYLGVVQVRYLSNVQRSETYTRNNILCTQLLCGHWHQHRHISTPGYYTLKPFLKKLTAWQILYEQPLLFFLSLSSIFLPYLLSLDTDQDTTLPFLSYTEPRAPSMSFWVLADQKSYSNINHNSMISEQSSAHDSLTALLQRVISRLTPRQKPNEASEKVHFMIKAFHLVCFVRCHFVL